MESPIVAVVMQGHVVRKMAAVEGRLID